jgi:hypothetical protein
MAVCVTCCDRDIIFLFLKEAAPDITGFVKEQYSTSFIVMEIKAEKLKLGDIYQTKKYADLFDAKCALVVSSEEIPDELKRLSKVALLYLGEYRAFSLVQFDELTRTFKEYFPENPLLRKL